MKIGSNTIAMMTAANMSKANKHANTAMQRLSSGLKINAAKDNPAGLAVSNKIDVQVRGLAQASDNSMNAISMVQTAEGALEEVHSMLNRLKEITVQGITDTVTDDDREKIQLEIDSLVDEIENISGDTEYNRIHMLNTNETINIQTGANTGQSLDILGDEIKLSQTVQEINGITLLPKDAQGNLITDNQKRQQNNAEMLEKIDKAVAATSEIRGRLGAMQNRLEHTVNNLGVSETNMTESLSRITDADMAVEMTNYTQNNIINQAGLAMLAQANQRPQQILQLLNS